MKKFYTKNLRNLVAMFLLTSGFAAQAQLRNPLLNTLTEGTAVESRFDNVNSDFCKNREVEVKIMLNDFQIPYGMSPDGTKVAIADYLDPVGYFWTYPDRLETIDGYVYDVDNAGKICGSFRNDQNYMVAAYWKNGEWTFLGMNPEAPQFFDGEDYSCAWAMSSDGEILAGLQFTEAWTTVPFTWTEAGGYVNLEKGLGYACRPNAICDDGHILGGWSADQSTGIWQPCLWIDGEMSVLLQSQDYGEVYGLSRNGQYACGYTGENAFIWSQTDGFQIIEDFAGKAVAVSNDGVLFGYGGEMGTAMVKPLNLPTMTFRDYAVERGWQEASQWGFTRVTDVSEDGNCVIGIGGAGATNCFHVNFAFAEDINENQVSVKVYPNPAKDFLSVEAAETGSEVRLINALGSVIYHGVMENEVLRINTQTLAEGVYCLEIQGEKNMSSSKVMICH